MGRIFFLDKLFSMYDYFFRSIIDMVSNYILPNIILAFITITIIQLLQHIANATMNKTLAIIVILLLILLEICIIAGFIIYFSWSSLFLTCFVISMVLLEIFIFSRV